MSSTTSREVTWPSRELGTSAGQTWPHAMQVVTASVPLSEMFGYMTQLRSLSQGRAVYSMQFSHFEAVPKSIASRFVGFGA